MMLAKITLDSSARNAPSGLVPGLNQFDTQSESVRRKPLQRFRFKRFSIAVSTLVSRQELRSIFHLPASPRLPRSAR